MEKQIEYTNPSHKKSITDDHFAYLGHREVKVPERRYYVAHGIVREMQKRGVLPKRMGSEHLKEVVSWICAGMASAAENTNIRSDEAGR